MENSSAAVTDLIKQLTKKSRKGLNWIYKYNYLKKHIWKIYKRFKRQIFIILQLQYQSSSDAYYLIVCQYICIFVHVLIKP